MQVCKPFSKLINAEQISARVSLEMVRPVGNVTNDVLEAWKRPGLVCPRIMSHDVGVVKDTDIT